MRAPDCRSSVPGPRREFEWRAGFQIVEEKLVYMLTGITRGRLPALQLGPLKDAGTVRFSQLSLSKRDAVSVALEVARMARDILRDKGISLESPVTRHVCNLESVRTCEGTHDIHDLIPGEAITGIPAFGGIT